MARRTQACRGTLVSALAVACLLMGCERMGPKPIVGAQGPPRLTRQQLMASADTDGDGTIDRLEFLERMREAFFFVDADRDGLLTLEEYQRLEGADPRGFARADRNKDGKLSLTEFLEAVNADFDAADRNHDGVLDDEEVKAWMAD